MTADDVVSHIGGVAQARGHVELQRLDVDLFTDYLEYDQLSDTAHAQGNVRINRALDWFTADRLDLLREADAVVQDEVRAAGLERGLWQAFAVLLPIKTVGVMGDYRTYAHVIALRAVTSQDAMTADWARLPYDLLGAISNRIINEVKGINRVVFDISSKPPSTIEWE